MAKAKQMYAASKSNMGKTPPNWRPMQKVGAVSKGIKAPAKGKKK